MQYIYKTTLFSDLTNVIGAPSTNDADYADFVTNHEASATDVSEVVVQTDYAETYLSYVDFCAKVALWSDVLDVHDGNVVTLYLVSTTPL
jgi:hypothetical protein